jgi:hypothetical protein
MVSPAALAAAPDGSLGLATLWDGRIATTRDWIKWEVARLGDGTFGYSMPSAAVVDSGCAYILAADGRLATFRK